MMYLAFQTQADVMQPVRAFAAQMASAMNGTLANMNGAAPSQLRNLSAAYELLARAGISHARPDFGIDKVMVGNREVAVTEQAAAVTPFGTLLHFKKDTDIAQPQVMVVAPLSGHFATLLRETCGPCFPSTMFTSPTGTMPATFRFPTDVSASTNMSSISSSFWKRWVPGAHIVAVCQPCVAALAAAAVMAKNGNKAQPKSLTLMAGPIDCRVNPTKVNELACGKPIEWFEKNLISTVPLKLPGGGRRVYPGFVQLSAFMAMNMERHVKAHVELYDNLAKGEIEKANVTKAFYDEYFAVLDLTEEFYLETVNWIFQEYRLPKGELKYKGELVEPKAIRKTSLLTVEGERDDICALGQTLAAQDLCSGIKPYRKRHHMQAGVGHYGVFSGRRWNSQIYPIVRNTILAAD